MTTSGEAAGLVRIGNASGFYGDREAAVREMLTGGRLDYLTGDYLAELTMLILAMDRLKDPGRGYARSFLRQMEDGLGLALDAGVKVVVNAGGLNPAGLATAVRDLAGRLGLSAAVAHVEGDDLSGRVDELGLHGPDGSAPLAANAYLGAWGIVAALDSGADVVVTGRVTDASLVVGSAAHHFGWSPDDLDALAGASRGSPRSRPVPTCCDRVSQLRRSIPTGPASSPSTPEPGGRSRSTPSPPSSSMRSAGPATPGPM
jgi:hypothetical protein